MSYLLLLLLLLGIRPLYPASVDSLKYRSSPYSTSMVELYLWFVTFFPLWLPEWIRCSEQLLLYYFGFYVILCSAACHLLQFTSSSLSILKFLICRVNLHWITVCRYSFQHLLLFKFSIIVQIINPFLILAFLITNNHSFL